MSEKDMLKNLDIILRHLDVIDSSCSIIKMQLESLKGAVNRNQSMTQSDKDLWLASIDEVLKPKSELDTINIRTTIKHMKSSLEIHAESKPSS